MKLNLHGWIIEGTYIRGHGLTFVEFKTADKGELLSLPIAIAL
jgi:hypothetical protein